MPPSSRRYRSRFATAVFDLLDPIPYGLFVGTLIFDIVYTNTADVFWAKGASWLVTTGLVIAIVPRLINLVHVWFPSGITVTRKERFDFWLNLFGIVAAVFNAFIHSRDGYAIVPMNVVLSLITVALLSMGHIMLAVEKFGLREATRE